uniref:protein-serine/threonine phosphatase n=2 Tax=Schistocephalus solidus TaxID=70667 RepID=A0A0X3NGS1_SCHSO
MTTTNIIGVSSAIPGAHDNGMFSELPHGLNKSSETSEFLPDNTKDGNESSVSPSSCKHNSKISEIGRRSEGCRRFERVELCGCWRKRNHYSPQSNRSQCTNESNSLPSKDGNSDRTSSETTSETVDNASTPAVLKASFEGTAKEKGAFFSWSPFSRLSFFKKKRSKKNKDKSSKHDDEDEPDTDYAVLSSAITGQPPLEDDTARLGEAPQSPTITLLGPPRESDRNKKCFIIDLDETLVHSSFKAVEKADFRVGVEIDGCIHQVYVLKRPFVDEFLQAMADIYECVLFTASLSKYADPVADFLDKWNVFRYRLFREACVYHRGNYVKDLAQIGRPIDQIVILDNSPVSYMFHATHAVQITSWFDDTSDRALLDLIPYFQHLAGEPNVVEFLRNNPPPPKCAVVGNYDLSMLNPLTIAANRNQHHAVSALVTQVAKADSLQSTCSTTNSSDSPNKDLSFAPVSSATLLGTLGTSYHTPATTNSTTSSTLLSRVSPISSSENPITFYPRTHSPISPGLRNSLPAAIRTSESLRSSVNRPLSTPVSSSSIAKSRLSTGSDTLQCAGSSSPVGKELPMKQVALFSPTPLPLMTAATDSLNMKDHKPAT